MKFIKPLFWKLLRENFDVFFPELRCRSIAMMLRKMQPLVGSRIEELTDADFSPICWNKYRDDGQLRECVLKLSAFLGENPEDLFELGLEFIPFQNQKSVPAVGLQPLLTDESLHNLASHCSELTPNEQKAISLRFALNGQGHTLDEAGIIMGVTRERVRQIEARGLRRLRESYRRQRQQENTEKAIAALLNS